MMKPGYIFLRDGDHEPPPVIECVDIQEKMGGYVYSTNQVKNKFIDRFHVLDIKYES